MTTYECQKLSKIADQLFSHRSPKRNVSNGGLWLNWNIRVCMKIRSLTFMWLNSFNVGVIYRIKTLEYSMCHLFSSWRELRRHLRAFERISVHYGVVNRDKVGNFGRSDDQTLFGNESNLHTKRAFTHNIFRWNHKVGPVVSLSAIQWTTHSVFSVLAWQNVEIWRPK